MQILKQQNNRGFSLIEVILASSVFVLLGFMLVGGIVYGQESSLKGALRSRAAMLAEEGLEAVRSIRNQNFSDLNVGTFGLSTSTGQWSLVVAAEYSDNFLREITITDIDVHQKKIISKVIWLSENNLENSVSLTTFLTDWSFVTPENLDSGVCSTS
ncbi:MAG: prepilin-type N-terminal cleavage/methylation domain-containing protein [Candidatus Magasanikbacteria bacterium]|jgi:prepilin-type N-terminal cleavage/methylation domain-containing protein